MAEITNLFKATVKTVKARNKAQGGAPIPLDKSMLGHKGQIHRKGDFEIKSQDVVSNITQLRDFLLEHRKEYINAFNHLGRSTTKMTDGERDQIDSEAEKYMRLCSDEIKSLKSRESANKQAAQVQEHRNAVISLLEAYLKMICNSYSEQRAVRVKRVVDRKRISRLEPDSKKSRQNTPASTQSSVEESADKEEQSKPALNPRSTEKASKQFSQLLHNNVSDGEETLSPEEIQMFEHENRQLYEDMNSMVDEVKQIEGKVVEISRLQQIFSEKVLDQETDIDRIAGTVVGTTENIKEANEEIREAMKNNAGLRVWILFFLIVCSFSLLFLDWYNA